MWVWYLSPEPDSSFLVRQKTGGSKDGSRDCVPDIHKGDLHCISSPQLWPGSAQAIVSIWRVNQHMADHFLFFSCSSLLLRNKQIQNTIFLKNKCLWDSGNKCWKWMFLIEWCKNQILQHLFHPLSAYLPFLAPTQLKRYTFMNIAFTSHTFGIFSDLLHIVCT